MSAQSRSYKKQLTIAKRTNLFGPADRVLSKCDCKTETETESETEKEAKTTRETMLLNETRHKQTKKQTDKKNNGIRKRERQVGQMRNRRMGNGECRMGTAVDREEHWLEVIEQRFWIIKHCIIIRYDYMLGETCNPLSIKDRVA